MKPHKFRLVPWLFSWKTYRLLQQKWNAYTEDPLIFINIVTLYDSIKTGCRLSALCFFLLGNFTLAFLGLLFGCLEKYSEFYCFSSIKLSKICPKSMFPV